jgi:4a-hydroxytetrahydrobiopterin dehydratase
MTLTDKKCVPCEGGTPPLNPEQIAPFVAELNDPKWLLSENKKISKTYTFENFKEAIVFVEKVAAIANEEDHHPDIFISYNLVRIDLFTHAIGGLSENDFIIAAKINAIQR